MLYISEKTLQEVGSRLIEAKYFFEEIFRDNDNLEINEDLKILALGQIDRIFNIIGALISDIIPIEEENEAFNDIFSTTYEWLDRIIPDPSYFAENEDFLFWTETLTLKLIEA